MWIRLARSLHITHTNIATPRGTYPPAPAGGIILFIPIAALCLIPPINALSITAVSALTLLAAITLADDITPLPPLLRLFTQIICVAIPIALASISPALSPLPQLSPLLSFIAAIFIIALMNTYNFMDGINALTPLYSLITLLTLIPLGIAPMAILPIIAAVAAMAIFNTRRYALSFAGDTGAILLGLITALLIIATGQPSAIAIVAVYLVDTILTLTHRILHGHNPLSPHQTHLYELLTYTLKISPILIAALYTAIQLIINIIYLLAPSPLTTIIIYLLLIAAWLPAHNKILNRYSQPQ